jgi:PhnB protein
VVAGLTKFFCGDSDGRVREPLGNVGWIQQRVAGLTPEEMERRAAQPEFIEATRDVQSAQLVEPAR